MNRDTTVLALSVLILASCASASVQSRPVEYRDDQGERAVGRITSYESGGYIVAEVEKRHPKPWKQYYRFGTWYYWFPSGHLRGIVNYGIGEYTECCVAGPCTSHYEYLRGRPQLFSEQGEPIPLIRTNAPGCIRTNCGECPAVKRPTFLLPPDLAPEWNPQDPEAP